MLPLSPEAQLNATILAANPTAILVSSEAPTGPAPLRITIATNGTGEIKPCHIAAAPVGATLRLVTIPPFRPLVCQPLAASAHPDHTRCHNEPIPAGVQIAPRGATWVGTYGLPVRHRTADGNFVYAALSNWHVMCLASSVAGHAECQPFANANQFASLTRWHKPTASGQHLVDAAIADTLHDGRHTVDRVVLGLGPAGALPHDLRVGDPVTKSGRTTGVTTGRVHATGAAVRVNYGTHTAELVDQDVIIDAGHSFSAAGDSGSAVLEASGRKPAALLFAGGGNLTIANPIRHVTEAMHLVWPVFS